MRDYLIIGIDTSIGFTKDEYLFQSEKKNIKCKYIPEYKTNKSDTLIATYLKNYSSAEEIYNAVTEILSAFAFTRDCQMIFYSGFNLRGNNNINLMNNRCSYIARTTPVTEKMDYFIYIPPITNPEQAVLVRLYRQANSNNNVYFRILFFWHVLVYPSKDNNDGVKYINKLFAALPKEISHYQDTINQIKANHHILMSRFSSLGDYIKDGIRHSIAHIVRDMPDNNNLTLDTLEEERHLWDVARVLKAFCRYRLENDYELNQLHDKNYFLPIVP